MRIAVLFFILTATTIQAQPLVYHCNYDIRQAAAKQTAETIVSDDGGYAYSLFGGKPLVWGLRFNPVIEWSGATNMSTDANNIVAQAFQDWEDVSGIDFDRQNDAENAVWPNEDGITQMLIADPTLLGGAQALTQRFITGTVVGETDIEFQSSLMGGSNDAFKLSIARHEIGHMLGLQHVESSSSLMFTSILVGTTKPIDQGSLDGITFLYGDAAGIRNLTAAYFDTLGTGIGRIFLEEAVTQLAFNRDQDEIYAQNDQTVWRSQDNGETWVEIAAEIAPLASGIASTEDGRIWTYPGSPPVSNYRAAPDDPQTLYGATAFVVYRSSDGGET